MEDELEDNIIYTDLDCYACGALYKLKFDEENVSNGPMYCPFCGVITEIDDEYDDNWD
jgi:hypothetical protein|tara:strand:- start:1637 stop:1810 length:174 start_codon:yes stop_codon:yes gene_type:complete